MVSGYVEAQSSQTIFTRPDDQLRIAEMFYTGKIVPENWTEAVNWFLKAAKAGNADAINRIGELWAAGVDGAPDGKEAVRWFRRAATKGCLAAQLNLARAYEKGDGVDHDLVQAWVWLKTAADAGAPSATAELQQVQAQLSPEQLQQARNSLRK